MTKHNPERRAWRGRSYKAAGRPVRQLKDEAKAKTEEDEMLRQSKLADAAFKADANEK